MNILTELTRHLIIASKNLKIQEPRIEVAEKIESKAFALPLLRSFSGEPPLLPSLMIQKSPKTPLEALTEQHSDFDADFDRISDLVSDHSITSIICDGPLRPLKIKRDGKSEILTRALDRQDIDYIVNRFSQKSGIQIKPVFRAKVGNVSMLALVSSAESRFMLTLDR